MFKPANNSGIMANPSICADKCIFYAINVCNNDFYLPCTEQPREDLFLKLKS